LQFGKFFASKHFRSVDRDEQVKIHVTVDCCNNGFTFPDEDGFFTSHFLSELENLNPFLNKNLDALMKDRFLSENPFEVATKKPKADKAEGLSEE